MNRKYYFCLMLAFIFSCYCTAPILAANQPTFLINDTKTVKTIYWKSDSCQFTIHGVNNVCKVETLPPGRMSHFNYDGDDLPHQYEIAYTLKTYWSRPALDEKHFLVSITPGKIHRLSLLMPDAQAILQK